MTRATSSLAVAALLLQFSTTLGGEGSHRPHAGVNSGSVVLSLDGEEWLLATDPNNSGREQRWEQSPPHDAQKTKVPWIIQDVFPAYHGVAWYWRDFVAPDNPYPGGRTLVRFWAVDYKADVWLNGVSVGEHEGGETPFTLDVTEAVRPGEVNRLAVRVLNPTHEPIDGIVLNETPHRNKVIPYHAGASFNHGGIVDSVELLVVPAVRIEDVFARPDVATGQIRLQVTVRNSAPQETVGRMEFTVALAAGGETLRRTKLTRTFSPGDTLVETSLHLGEPRLWDLNEPNLYRVTARVTDEQADATDEQSVRCGFRDFRFSNGYFRLNGRRIFLRCSHTGNHCPIGLQLPPDPDMLRRDLLNVKVMGFNAIRFISGMATRYQLDLCDEIGLLVYEEPYGSWCLADSPHMAARYDQGLSEMIQRDRNHPSVVIWGLLNETPDGPIFRHAVGALQLVRQLDDSRMVMLNSGRWDQHGDAGLTGLEIWATPNGPDPNVNRNSGKQSLSGLGITWQPQQLALHPGPQGELSVVRWQCPESSEYMVDAVFSGIATAATTNVHVLLNGRSLHDGLINVQGHPNTSTFSQSLSLQAGDTVDFVVGYGNQFYGGDTTALSARIRASTGRVADAAADFSIAANPAGDWSYGYLAPGPEPDAATFTPYSVGRTLGEDTGIGSLSNPGTSEWQDVLDDKHPYQRVPHTASVIQSLRTIGGGGKPLFVSEYGVGSAVDLWRVTRHYERMGAEHAEDAQFYRDKLDRFLVDWDRWKMAECFATPQDFFAQSIRQMAAERLYGLNALRANPAVVAHSVTGTVDQGMSGEGLFTTFRELKPGTTDAMFDAWAPLRLCLFAEPLHIYRGDRIKLEALLANEDALPNGEYAVHLQVIGPGMNRVVDRVVPVTVSARIGEEEPPLVVPFFEQNVSVDGPPGAYRFLATMQQGGAPLGGEATFFVHDPQAMPDVELDVVLWGDDPELRTWLEERGVRVHPSLADSPAAETVVLVSRTTPTADADAWQDLARHAARGGTVVFLSPAVFQRGDDTTGWLPLPNRGRLATSMGWLYHKDEWAKTHPVFAGLPSGGMMDYAFYREIIPDGLFVGLDPPDLAIAGANNASFDYSSGLMLAEYHLGAGRILLNSLLIRERLAHCPVAERLLRNLLRYAAGDF